MLALLLLIGFFVFGFILWASTAKLDITVFGSGKVVPSVKLQIIQNLEGGIISEIHVLPGEYVHKGDLLLEIDSTEFKSDFEQLKASYYSVLASAARLAAEAEGEESVVYPSELDAYVALVEQENKLFNQRMRELKASQNILMQQLEQKKLNIDEIEQNILSEEREIALIQEEIRLNKPLVKRGITSKVEFIRLKRELAGMQGRLAGLNIALSRAGVEVEETSEKVVQHQAIFRSKARAEQGQLNVQISSMSEALKGEEDRFLRRQVKAPVSGIVNRVLINTIGGVSRPGDDLVEIVPDEGGLQVEMAIEPSEIGFVTVGQPAIIRFTAYDSSIFGSVEGEVLQVGADTLKDDKGKVYYQVIVKTRNNYVGDDKAKLPIIPGMVAQIHITTGTRTLLDYIIKPIKKLRAEALRER